MRTREEIEADTNWVNPRDYDHYGITQSLELAKAQLEVSLDIRDLLLQNREQNDIINKQLESMRDDIKRVERNTQRHP